jgi:hypothetical protein
MRSRPAVALGVGVGVLGVTACGDAGSPVSADASPAIVDAIGSAPDGPPLSPACGEVSATNQQLDGGSEIRIDYSFDVAGGPFAPGTAHGAIIFRGGRGDLSGTYDLSDPAQQDLATCTACVLVYAGDENPTKVGYMQRAGQLVLDVDPMAGLLAGRITDLELGESTLSLAGLTSSPIEGGDCVGIASLELDVPL